MAVCPLDLYFESDASRLILEIMKYGRIRGRVSALMEKGTIPEGAGFNYSTVISERTSPADGYIWTPVEAPDGVTNNCVPDVTDITWATNILSYTASQALLRSDRICFTDVSRGYLFEEQVANIQKNFVNNVVDAWEIQDKAQFFANAGVKIVADGTMTTYYNQADFGPTEPTTPIAQAYLDEIYTQLIQDGAGEDAYAYSGGAPIFTAIMSQEAHRTLIKNNADIRQDFRFAEEGFGDKATLLSALLTDKAYGGFMHMIDSRMPRYNFVEGEWVEVPFYSQESAHIGNSAPVNPAYKWAQYEDVYIWHPKVVQRLMAKTPHSVGSDTQFDAVPYTGDVVWRNIPEGDITQCEANPLGNWGRYWAQLQAAWRPGLRRYGVVLRVKRCFNLDVDGCPGGY